MHSFHFILFLSFLFFFSPLGLNTNLQDGSSSSSLIPIYEISGNDYSTISLLRSYNVTIFGDSSIENEWAKAFTSPLYHIFFRGLLSLITLSITIYAIYQLIKKYPKVNEVEIIQTNSSVTKGIIGNNKLKKYLHLLSLYAYQIFFIIITITQGINV